jgi:hypothetical protein
VKGNAPQTPQKQTSMKNATQFGTLFKNKIREFLVKEKVPESGDQSAPRFGPELGMPSKSEDDQRIWRNKISKNMSYTSISNTFPLNN